MYNLSTVKISAAQNAQEACSSDDDDDDCSGNGDCNHKKATDSTSTGFCTRFRVSFVSAASVFYSYQVPGTLKRR